MSYCKEWQKIDWLKLAWPKSLNCHKKQKPALKSKRLNMTTWFMKSYDTNWSISTLKYSNPHNFTWTCLMILCKTIANVQTSYSFFISNQQQIAHTSQVLHLSNSKWIDLQNLFGGTDFLSQIMLRTLNPKPPTLCLNI